MQYGSHTATVRNSGGRTGGGHDLQVGGGCVGATQWMRLNAQQQCEQKKFPHACKIKK
jgi:hypothetical protein